MTVRQLVEGIAKKDNRSVAMVFYTFFSRFEFALKRAGFVAKSDDAKANWEAYARRNPDLIEGNQNKDLADALAFLKNSPPKRQVIVNGKLDWASDKYSGPYDLARVLCLICRIRNNLFHGGKFQNGPEPELSRDTALLTSGLVIMEACLESDPQTKEIFVEGIDW